MKGLYRTHVFMIGLICIGYVVTAFGQQTDAVPSSSESAAPVSSPTVQPGVLPPSKTTANAASNGIVEVTGIDSTVAPVKTISEDWEASEAIAKLNARIREIEEQRIEALKKEVSVRIPTEGAT